MTRCWNADDFAIALAKMSDESAQLRAVLEQGKSTPQDISEQRAADERSAFWLECHAREFFIDSLLSNLNWNLRASTDAQGYLAANLVIEQAPDSPRSGRVREPKTDTTRRMDYLGYQRDTDEPLLVVEAKRPSTGLPTSSSPASLPDNHPSVFVIADALNKLKSDPPPTKLPLRNEWREILTQVRGYCQSLADKRGCWPTRAIITNGEWLIVFVSPELAFGADSIADNLDQYVLVFESRAKVAEHHTFVWQHLEYANLTKEERRIDVAQIGYYIQPEQIKSYCFGIRVSYTTKTLNYRKAPLLSVSPLLFVMSIDDSFIQVATDFEDEIPTDGKPSILEHLQRIKAKATELKVGLEQRGFNGRVVPMASLVQHCENANALRNRPLCQVMTVDGGEVFLIVTGDETHFITERSVHANCAFHQFANANLQGAAQQPGPTVRSDLESRSYFLDSTSHHCAHREVHVVKREQITKSNKDACGYRSESVDQAFCVVWRMESFLCCQICAFKPVCKSARAFYLPCEAFPTQVSVGGRTSTVGA